MTLGLEQPVTPASPRGPSRGQSLVELALLLPVALAILVAILDFGYYLFVSISINYATRAGVRRASMNNLSRSQIRSIIRNQCPGVHIPAANPPESGNPPAVKPGEAIRITTTAADSSFSSLPPSVEIQVSFEHTFLIPMFNLGSGKSAVSPNVYAASKSVVVTHPGAPTISF